MFEEKDETIMARWLAGELTEAEQKEFEASEEFQVYQQMRSSFDALEKPEYAPDPFREKIWQAIERQNEPKVIPLKKWYWAAGVAASIVLIFGVFFSQVTYRSAPGEKQMVLLPDGSQVQLNANSSLKRRRFFWKRQVHLEGEALFKVEKGDGFEVSTARGNIRVLGTVFNIKSREHQFEVRCYEGKVQYSYPVLEQSTYLVAGDAVQLLGEVLLEFKHQDPRPLWMDGKSVFSNSPLPLVIEELENQYAISIRSEVELTEGGYTGTFYHDNLELALQAVFLPMGYTYQISADGQSVLLSR